MSIPMNICWECEEERVVNETCLGCIYEHVARLDEYICEKAGIEGPYFTFSKSSLKEDLEKKYLCGVLELSYATIVCVGGMISPFTVGTKPVIQMLSLSEILNTHYCADGDYDEVVVPGDYESGLARFSQRCDEFIAENHSYNPFILEALKRIDVKLQEVGVISNSKEGFLTELVKELAWKWLEYQFNGYLEGKESLFDGYFESLYEKITSICQRYPHFIYYDEKGYVELICKDDATLIEILQKKLDRGEFVDDLRVAVIFFLQERYGITYSSSSEEEKKLLATPKNFPKNFEPIPTEPEKDESADDVDSFVNIVLMGNPHKNDGDEIIVPGLVFLDEPGRFDLVVPAQYKGLLVDGRALSATGAVQDGKFIVKVMKSM